MANAVRNYKDSLFTHLFGHDPRLLVELYNAISGTDYPPDTPVEITTLEGVLYAGLKNDISFQLDGRYVVLAEHQSTINENMPIRLLLYAARVYEQILSSDNLYRRRLVKLPAPEFVVLYNGEEPFPREKLYRLSDAYLAQPGENTLELKVRVININAEQDSPVLRRSETLAGYSSFVQAVREHQEAGLSLNEAIQKSIHQCIDQGILREFLEKNGSEVRNMVLTEWDENEARRIAAEEAREEAREETLKKSQKEVAIKLLRKGMPISEIGEVVELSEEQIEKLRKEI